MAGKLWATQSEWAIIIRDKPTRIEQTVAPKQHDDLYDEEWICDGDNDILGGYFI